MVLESRAHADSLHRALRLPAPVRQRRHAFVCETPELAASVCPAGGVGALTGFARPDRLRENVRELRRRTDAPFHVNLLGVLPKVARRFESVVPVPETTRDFEEMPWLAGQGVGQVHAVRPAAQIVEDLMGKAAAVFGALAP